MSDTDVTTRIQRGANEKRTDDVIVSVITAFIRVAVDTGERRRAQVLWYKTRFIQGRG